MSIEKQLQELFNADIIDQQTVLDIQDYYKSKGSDNGSRLLLIFGVLGALLVGLGIILILAHNWDTLPRFVKTVFAFLPLIVGQVLCWYSLSKTDSKIWQESSAVFLTMSIGASIALVSQIYNLEGDLQGFIMIWMILVLPVVYVMESSMTSLLYIIASVTFAIMSGWSNSASEFFISLALLGAIIPFYFYQMNNYWESNALTFHHYLIPISLLFVLSSLIGDSLEFTSWMYLNVFGLLYMLGNAGNMRTKNLRTNGYIILGALGTIVILLIYTFEGAWGIGDQSGLAINDETNLTFLGVIISALLGVLGLLYHYRKDTLDKTSPIMPVFLIFGAIYLFGQNAPFLGAILINLLILSISVLTIVAGVKKDHLGILNYGLIILTILLICRFLDSNISFVSRGVLFILVGVAFFMANNFLINKRKANDQ